MNKAKFFAVALASVMALTSGTAMAAGDAAKGKKVFKKCKACHRSRPVHVRCRRAQSRYRQRV